MSFEDKVLEILKKVPKGQLTTYKEIAKKINNKKAARAVGNALRKNKEPIIIPCHRVVKSDGHIGGYALGKKKKIELLSIEGIDIKRDKIVDFKSKLYKF